MLNSTSFAAWEKDLLNIGFRAEHIAREVISMVASKMPNLYELNSLFLVLSIYIRIYEILCDPIFLALFKCTEYMNVEVNDWTYKGRSETNEFGINLE